MTITTKYNVGDTVWFDYGNGDFREAVVTQLHFSAKYTDQSDLRYDLARLHEELAQTYRANAQQAEREQVENERAFEYLKSTMP